MRDIIHVSPTDWALPVETAIPEHERCVNFGGQRDDGSKCQDRAEPGSGWCAGCKP